MGKLILDSDLRAKLNGLTEQLEVCDSDGRTVGLFLPVDHYRKLVYAAVEAACPFSAEELARRQQETGGRPLKEIWKSLGQ
jgi:hypothetical protein